MAQLTARYEIIFVLLKQEYNKRMELLYYFKLITKFQAWSSNASPPPIFNETMSACMSFWPRWCNTLLEHDNGAIYCQGVISLI